MTFAHRKRWRVATVASLIVLGETLKEPTILCTANRKQWETQSAGFPTEHVWPIYRQEGTTVKKAAQLAEQTTTLVISSIQFFS